MVTEIANHTWIKDHLMVATHPISESLSSQRVVFNELGEFNDKGHKAACSNARNTGDSDKGVNVSSIMDARLVIAIHVTKYYEDLGRTIEPNVMEWIRIKHTKSLIQIKDNWRHPEPLP